MMKKKIFLFSLLTIISLSITGCSKTAMPNFYNGHYFMAGDDNCRRMSSISSTRIMCYDKNGKEMGWRDAMTDQQLSMYQHNQNIQQRESEQLNQSIQNLNNQMNYNNQQMMNRNNVYKFQQVGPYGY